ncbi:MAG: hypothetical protein Q9222_006870 [Ikaeria aurantiellina]
MQTPTGKNFHQKPSPNRMKPLPPLRTTFDGGGGEGARAKSKEVTADKPTTSGSDTTFQTPAPTYFSAAPSGVPSTAASVPRAGALPFVQETNDSFYFERQRGRPFNEEAAEREEDRLRHGIWGSIRGDGRTTAD